MVVQLHGRLVANDRLLSAAVAIGTLVLAIPLVLMLVFLVQKGWGLLSVHLFFKDLKGVGPLSRPGSGGLGMAIIGTLEQVGLAIVWGVPAGIITAIFLNEVGGRFTSTVRTVVTAMAGLPSIMAGVFIYSIWIVTLGEGFSGLAGSFAIAIMLLPSITRTTEEVLKVVSGGLREAALALGAPEWRTVWSVVIADRKDRDHHRRGARCREGRWRDGTTAFYDFRQQLHQRQPVQRAPVVFDTVSLPEDQEFESGRGEPRLHRWARPCDHRPFPLHDHADPRQNQEVADGADIDLVAAPLMEEGVVQLSWSHGGARVALPEA